MTETLHDADVRKERNRAQMFFNMRSPCCHYLGTMRRCFYTNRKKKGKTGVYHKIPAMNTRPWRKPCSVSVRWSEEAELRIAALERRRFDALPRLVQAVLLHCQPKALSDQLGVGAGAAHARPEFRVVQLAA